MSLFFGLGNKTTSSSNNDKANLFSGNIGQQTQTALFGDPQNTNSNLIEFDSSIFKKDNKQTLFPTNNNLQKNLFGAPQKQDDTKKDESKQNTNPFSFDNQMNNYKTNFAFPQNNIINQNKSNINVKNSFLHLGNNPKGNETSFWSISKEKENKEEKNIDGKEKQNEEEKKNELKGGLFNNALPLKIELPKLFSQEPSNEQKSLFNNNNNNEEKNEPKKELFKICINKEEEKSDKKDDSQDVKKDISINIKNEEDKKENNFLGLFQKDEKNTFKISTSNNPLQILDNNNNNIINQNNNNVANNNNNNNLPSFHRIEDNEEMQNALKNLFISDVLLPERNFNYPIFDENIRKQFRLPRLINYKLIVEIEGTTDINDEGFSMVSKPNEKMCHLMKIAKYLVKNKYKIYKESNDFEVYLLKNKRKLPINDKELIKDHVKNRDNIIVSLVHKNSEKNERMEEEEDVNEENENNIKRMEKRDLCPQDKLPVLTKYGYHMHPNECIIARMTIEEIKNVKNFAIYNKNGKIEFDNPVSLYGVNLDNLFNIEHDLIEYENDKWYHSPRGENFNIPATITLYNIYPNTNLSNLYEKKLYIEFLKEKCQRDLKGTFLSYDFETYELKYKIPYFY